MTTRLQVHLAGTINGQPVDLRRPVDLGDGTALDLADDGSSPAGVCLAMLSATVPALATQTGLVHPAEGLPVHARTRVDLLGEHGRDLGTVVIVSSTRTSDAGSTCDAVIQQGALALEVGERLRVAPAKMSAVVEASGCLVHASVPVTGNRGTDYVADVVTRLWNAELPA